MAEVNVPSYHISFLHLLVMIFVKQICQLGHHLYLDSLGLVVNQTLRCLCCEWCQVAIPPAQVSAHLKNSVHKGSGFSVNPTKLKNALTEMGVEDDLPLPPCTTWEQSAPYPFHGLKVLKGFACHLCSQLTISEKYLRDHYTMNHPNDPSPSQLHQCLMQRLSLASSGPHRVLFRVKAEDLINMEQDSPLAQVQAQMNKVLAAPRKRNTVDQRSVSPWLLTTQWHKHVKDYDVKELCGLVSFPKKTEFPGLQEVVEEYFLEATDEIPTYQELTLQILNTADPVKTYVEICSCCEELSH
jgi:hypothetical protein